ncbi:ABC transporter ATP-binding protein [Levilactobacillus fujinensis]|uniref:ABC transporter ATP-binding protein n=1 Tax=Levilactobacillus fujinensis TaxID=2486024 RepID=A0ABW1TDN5_9LACO|nr:ABC transporter ATP-binding protein [Levilactobacillus fujinensis]
MRSSSKSNVVRLFSKIKFPWLLFVSGIGLTLFGVSFSLVLPLEVRTFVDNFKTGLSASRLVLIVGLLVGSTLFSVGSNFLLGVAGQQIVRDLRAEVSAHVIHLPIPFFDKTRSGEIASHISSDTQKINDLISNNISFFVSGTIMTIGSVVILFMLSKILTLIIGLTITIMAISLIPIAQKESVLQHATQNELGKYSADLQQGVSEIHLIKTSNAEDHVSDGLVSRIKTLYRANLGITKLSAIIDPIEYTLLMGTFFIVFVSGGSLVAKNIISVGSLTSFLLYVFQIMTPISSMSHTFAEFKSADGAAQTLIDLFDEPVEKDNPSQTRLAKGTNAKVTFTGVNFAYAGSDKKIINDLSLSFDPGKITALVGPSGGGKSTILGLVERFYMTDSGTIRYGQEDIKTLSLKDWRRNISYVSQETSILFGTVRDNLTFGLLSQPTDAQLMQALDAASASDFVKQLPQGLDTPLSEQGQNLSGGQIQRLMIARAFLRPASIIIFDEATANLDSASESTIETSIDRLRQDKTVIVVAHRLATVKNADRIFFIEKGHVTGTGTHQELIQTHALYKQYVEEQLL